MPTRSASPRRCPRTRPRGSSAAAKRCRARGPPIPERGNALELLRRYRFAHQAELARSTLEAFGVPAFVSLPVRGDEEPELRVRRSDLAAARELLAGDHSAELAAVPESRLPPGADELCPRCGSEVHESARLQASGRGLLGFLRRRRAVRCRACGHDWRR